MKIWPYVFSRPSVSFIISDNRFLPAAVRRRPRRAAEPWPFPAVWHLILPHLRHDLILVAVTRWVALSILYHRT
jgi:hypothetical protein